MEQLFAGRGVDVDAMHRRMKGLMAAEGLPYGKRTHTYNSRLAQEVGAWADSTGKGDALHNEFYRAYFVDARNIGDTEVILDVVGKVGLPVKEAREILETRGFKEAVDADWRKAHAYGVTGVPTFAVGRKAVIGAQPYAQLAEFVETVGAAPRQAS